MLRSGLREDGLLGWPVAVTRNGALAAVSPEMICPSLVGQADAAAVV